MIGPYRIEGHAIVSADDRIAGPDGVTPPALRHEGDWRRFQAALDRAAVVVLGRLGHAANPNAAGRRRLVVSTAAAGLERRPDAWWWNPAAVPAADALAQAAPGAGTAAVVGGRRVFDLFLGLGYDAFVLVRMPGVVLGAGVPVFSTIGADRTADELLAAAGLRAALPEPLDEHASAVLTRWVRPPLC